MVIYADWHETCINFVGAVGLAGGDRPVLVPKQARSNYKRGVLNKMETDKMSDTNQVTWQLPPGLDEHGFAEIGRRVVTEALNQSQAQFTSGGVSIAHPGELGTSLEASIDVTIKVTASPQNPQSIQVCCICHRIRGGDTVLCTGYNGHGCC